MPHEIKQESKGIYIGCSFSDELKPHTAVNLALLSINQQIYILSYSQ